MTTPQTDAPERIWLEIDRRARITGQPEAHIEPVDGVKDAFTAYIRADALDARDATIAVLVEALDLADAALSGANMNINVVERKVSAALAKAAALK